MSVNPNFKIEVPSKADYAAIVYVWEASVRVTHHFLKEEDIQFFKPLILNEFLDVVQLHCVRVENKLAAFLGTSDDKIEMLFVHPFYHGKGLGKKMLLFATQQLHKTLVDVNEQNEKAVAFYQHFGFGVISRSSIDGMGKPYPILHMELKEERLP